MAIDSQDVDAQVEDGVAIWTITRAARRNALSRRTVRALYALAREAEDDRTIRAVIITGQGDKAFCAGADLKERRGMSEEDVRDFLSLYRVAFDAIDRLNKPVVAALNGAALGGGFELALACDFRVAAAHAVVGLPEVSLAIIPGAGGTQRLTRIVGAARAKELILLGTRLDAQAALGAGLVTRVADENQSALEAARDFVETLVSGAPIAIAAALAAIDQGADMSLDAGLLWERRCYEKTLASEDRLEALAAFSEKRKPVYRGN